MLFVNAELAMLDQPISLRLIDLLLSDLPFRIIAEYSERVLSAFPPFCCASPVSCVCSATASPWTM